TLAVTEVGSHPLVRDDVGVVRLVVAVLVHAAVHPVLVLRLHVDRSRLPGTRQMLRGEPADAAGPVREVRSVVLLPPVLAHPPLRFLVGAVRLGVPHVHVLLGCGVHRYLEPGFRAGVTAEAGGDRPADLDVSADVSGVLRDLAVEHPLRCRLHVFLPLRRSVSPWGRAGAGPSGSPGRCRPRHRPSRQAAPDGTTPGTGSGTATCMSGSTRRGSRSFRSAPAWPVPS